jgi:CheY-like chemotaxis protein
MQLSPLISLLFSVIMHVLRVLLAEDNPLDQDIAEKMLRMLGHNVDVVANCAEAVLAVERAAYDLVIME